MEVNLLTEDERDTILENRDGWRKAMLEDNSNLLMNDALSVISVLGAHRILEMAIRTAMVEDMMSGAKND